MTVAKLGCNGSPPCQTCNRMSRFSFPSFDDEHFLAKTILGSLLMFLPIANFFALGYLHRFLKTPRRRIHGGLLLPEWTNWSRLFLDGLTFCLWGFLFFFVNWLLATCFCLLIWLLSFGFLAVHCCYLLKVFSLFLLPFFLIFLVQGRRDGKMLLSWRCFFDLHVIQRLLAPMIFPTLAFLGLQLILGRIYGLAWFVGLEFLCAAAILTVEEWQYGCSENCD